MANGNAAPPDEPGLMERIIAWPRTLSLAATIAWLIFLLLLITVTAIWGMYFFGESHRPYRDWISWPRILTVVLLIGVIPAVAYAGLRLWLEGEASPYPDIDFAWKAGLEALQRAGLSLDGAPLFVVLGTPSERQARTLLGAGGFSFRVAGLPEGRSPLHWFANPDGIWLFCTEVGWLSALTRLGERKGSEVHVSEDWRSDELLMSESSLVGPNSNGPVPGGAASALASPKSGAVPKPGMPRAVPPGPATAMPQARLTDSQRGTILLEQFVLEQQAPPQRAPEPAPVEAAPEANRPSETLRGMAPVSRVPWTERAGRSVAELQPVLVPPQDSAEQTQRLEYLSQLLRNARHPLCGVNGVLTLLAFESLLGNAQEIEEIQRAIRSDLLTLQRGLQLRFPVSAMVIGMERERGFSELVRRVGPERAFAQRFGRRYEVRAEPSPAALNDFASHVGGVFEDWVYTLFRENQALSRPGNTRLYGLLSKMRCNIKPRLAEILAGGFGYDPRQSPHDDPALFSGCYFAATGDSPDRQAFVKGVLGKLIEEQENVEWTRAMFHDEQRNARWVAGAIAVSLALSAALVILVVSHWA